MKVSRLPTLILLSIFLDLAECNANGQKPAGKARKITVTTVQSKNVTITQQYVCKINSRRRIEVRTLTDGKIAAILVKEGQAVKQGDLLFHLEPSKDKQKPNGEKQDKMFSIKAPFDGLVGRLLRPQGSVVLEGDGLTTLSDNVMMWVYFNVPESRYLEYMAGRAERKEDEQIGLVLANGEKFAHPGIIGAIGAKFNHETGTIPFRADFQNPEGLLHHGQTGTVVIRRTVKDAPVIPQRATFEILDKRYVYVVDKDHIAHQREIIIQNETEDLFLVKKGIGVGDKIVLDGVRQVRDGDKVE